MDLTVIGMILKKIEVERFSLRENLTEEDIKTIKDKLGISENSEVLGFFDDTITGNNKKGLAITSSGIYWNTDGTKINGKIVSKGKILSSDYQKYFFEVTKKGQNILFDNAFNDPKLPSVICFSMSIQSDEVFAITMNKLLSSLSFLPERPYECQKLFTYVGDEDIEAYTYYKKVFKKYEEKNGGFAFCWNWHAMIFNGLMLFHRKLYTTSIVFLTLFVVSLFVFSGTATISGPVLFTFPLIMGTLVPFLIYKRYKKIELIVESKIQDNQKRLIVFREMGGTNLFTKIVAGIFSIIVLIWFFIGFKIAAILLGIGLIVWGIMLIVNKSKRGFEKSFKSALTKAG